MPEKSIPQTPHHRTKAIFSQPEVYIRDLTVQAVGHKLCALRTIFYKLWRVTVVVPCHRLSCALTGTSRRALCAAYKGPTCGTYSGPDIHACATLRARHEATHVVSSCGRGYTPVSFTAKSGILCPARLDHAVMGNQFSGLEAALKQLEAGLVGKAATPSSTVNVAQTFAWALPYWSSDAEAKIRFALPGCKNPKILDALLEALSNELRNVNLVSRDYAFEADKVGAPNE